MTQGEDDTAPSPFVPFPATLGTCAVICVLSFCRERNILTENITFTQRLVYAADAEGTSSLHTIALDINVPAEFPDKYHKAIIRVADQCAMKKAIANRRSSPSPRSSGEPLPGVINPDAIRADVAKPGSRPAQKDAA